MDLGRPDASESVPGAAPGGPEGRLRGVPFEALGPAGSLERPLAAVLAGEPAERVLSRALRARPSLDGMARRAVAEAVFGVGLWRRRLRASLGLAPQAEATPLLLLAALLRDLAGRSDAEALAGIAVGALPAARPPPEALADRASLPDWLASELERAAGPEAAALAGALNAPGPLCLRVNGLRASPAEVAGRLSGEAVSTVAGRLAPGCLVVSGSRASVLGLAAHREGLVEVQDEGSQLAGLAAGARAGEVVLDLCAGAGGKTLQLAAAVGLRGRVHAADPEAERLVRLRARAARAGAAAIVAVHGASPPEELLVDRALVDAPCSALGPLRRGPDLRWRLDPAGFAALPALQGTLLGRAARHVRPGGRLAYVTCTFRREENEEVALAFEAAHPEFGRVAALPDGALARGADPATLVGPDLFMRTWPHRHGTDGFFAAAWVRRGRASR